MNTFQLPFDFLTLCVKPHCCFSATCFSHHAAHMVWWSDAGCIHNAQWLGFFFIAMVTGLACSHSNIHLVQCTKNAVCRVPDISDFKMRYLVNRALCWLMGFNDAEVSLCYPCHRPLGQRVLGIYKSTWNGHNKWAFGLLCIHRWCYFAEIVWHMHRSDPMVANSAGIEKKHPLQ